MSNVSDGILSIVSGDVAPAARSPIPGDVLLHPMFLIAVTTLLVNDHVLKRAAPGFITGKLSDVAAMVLCPIFLAAVWELVRRCERRSPIAMGSHGVVAVCVLVAVAFAAMKIFSLVGDSYGEILGHLRAAMGFSALPVSITHDPTDALTAVFVLLPGLLLVRRSKCGLRKPQK